MKKLILLPLLTPLFAFAAAPVKKADAWQETQTNYANMYNAQHFAGTYLKIAPVHKQSIADTNVFIQWYLRKTQEWFFIPATDENRTYRPKNEINLKYFVSDYCAAQLALIQTNRFAITTIPQKVYDDLLDSCVLKLDFAGCPNLNEDSKERLRKAWATPTELFPKGRNPANLILPAASTTSSTADNKDQKS